MQVGSTPNLEKPENGVAGLKHWRHDLVAGLVVSLVSLPFSLGIAIASGAPPVCGLISAIIAGLILPFLGGSYVTISGPAAGLAPALFAAMMLLGRGNKEVGYPLLLVAISLTGVVQIILAQFKLARFSAMFPASVVEGMLASIGLLIIAKQLPLIFGSPGNKFEAHEFWGIIREVPTRFMEMDPKVFLLGMFCLALIFALASLKARWVRVVPPQVIVAVIGLILGWFMGLKGDRLIEIPAQPFKNGFQFPHFYAAFADHSLWWALATTILTLTLIDGVESLATIAAIDKIDPFRRKSDPNKTLNAMGLSNLCSSLAGGLTIIPGGVKSTTGILTGARTQWANFYNACFLIVYLLLGRSLINLMPMSVLGAIVLYTGYRLCAPKVWKHVKHIGSEQLFVFTTTVLVTVTTDLLWGIAAGVMTKLLLETMIVTRVARGQPERREGALAVVRRWLSEAGELFRDPVVQHVSAGDTYHLYFGRPMVCFNVMHFDRAMAQIPRTASAVSLHITDLVTLIDHTAAATVLEFVDSFKRTGRGVVTVIGLDKLRARSHAEACMRISAPILAQERAEALTALAQISLTHISSLADDPALYLERISLTHFGPIEGQEDHPVNQGVVIGAKYLARKTRDIGNFIRNALVGEEEFRASARDLEWSSLSRMRDRDDMPTPGAIEKSSLSSSEHPQPGAHDWICLPELAPAAVQQDERAFRPAVSLGKSLQQKVHAVGHFVLRALMHDENFRATDRDLAATSLSWTEVDVKPPSAIDKLSLSSSEQPRADIREWLCVVDFDPKVRRDDEPAPRS